MPSPPSLFVRTVTIDAPGGITLHADIYDPATPGHERVAVLMLHRGAWRFGDRSMMRIRAEALAAHGFVVVSADYRLLGDAPWPAQLADSRAWIRWIRANAPELGVSRSRVAVLGCSAGGHLAMLCGSTGHNGAGPEDAAPDAIIAIYPPTDLPTESQVRLLGEDPDPLSVHQASPISHVAFDFPPTMFVHGLAADVRGRRAALGRSLPEASAPRSRRLRRRAADLQPGCCRSTARRPLDSTS